LRGAARWPCREAVKYGRESLGTGLDKMSRLAGPRRRILFVQPSKSPFIRADADLLGKHHDLRVLDLSAFSPSIGSTISVAYRMLKGVLWADLTFVWFADKHAKWATRFGRLFGKPTVVVVGGYEVAKVPEIGHGLVLDAKGLKISRYVHRRATKILPVDGSLKEDAVKNLGVTGDNIEPLPTGYDSEVFKPSGPKERMALTVGIIDGLNLKRKGLAVFVQAAAHLPDVKFVLVGNAKGDALETLREKATPNVEFPGWVSHEELTPYYQRAKVYCQLSLYEGLPNALCEAMLCECVPVGTKVNGIPSAMGDTGFFVPAGDAKAAAVAIRQALDSGKGKEARERIKNLLPVEKREKRLLEIVEELTG